MEYILCNNKCMANNQALKIDDRFKIKTVSKKQNVEVIEIEDLITGFIVDNIQNKRYILTIFSESSSIPQILFTNNLNAIIKRLAFNNCRIAKSRYYPAYMLRYADYSSLQFHIHDTQKSITAHEFIRHIYDVLDILPF